ncbi:MAG TPA: aminotransferase class I/II-fold pyridoxal phosphate-dependent enzyme [Agriterribacter sp.]|nr:aminotransferase class I/II-fold pyridoxal phosphate-dependent enzyme [Chitinophagaceae bacterium]HRP31148.1 aminotransferase class I/II-fold pyridoxal phosphate-dependent enzyme [Agriterribacter sp.]
MQSKIWLSSPHMGGNERKYVEDAFAANWVAPLGPNVNGLEEDIARYLLPEQANQFHVAALSSGTAAIHLGLILLGVKAGDEVICQSLTFSASANPIAYQGATPIFIDSELDTWNMSPEFLEKAIKDRIVKGKKPKAIIPVHLYGMPAKMNEITSLADQYEIPVLEDAAEALGSHINGKMCGTFGIISALSFNGNKIITTSGGGAFVTPRKEWAEKARFLSTQARDPAPHYQHSHIGYNYRMSNICAGIGRGQMEVLQQRVVQRRENFDRYKKELAALEAIHFLDAPEGYYSNRWLTTVLVKDPVITREIVRLALENAGIESRPLWKPMHCQPVFKDAPFYGDGTAKQLFEDGICLPSGSNLTEEERDRVVSCIKTVFS